MAVTVTEPTGAVSGNWVFATVKGTHQEVVDWISQTGKASQGFFIYGFTSDLSLIHIPSPRDRQKSRMPSSA